MQNYLRKKTSDEIVVVFDNAVLNEFFDGGGVINRPEEHRRYYFDKLIISNRKKEEVSEIYQQCISLGIAQKKISIFNDDLEMWINAQALYNQYDEKTDPRVRWIKNFSIYADEEAMQGNVAECGVNRGEFAYFINKYFKQRRLYLFDTFEGFSQKDLEIENSFNDRNFSNGKFNSANCFIDNNLEITRRRMIYPDNVEIYRGHFPESARSITDTFCFVNLDMDLYKPMLDALRFFYPLTTKGGAIVMHDYFRSDLPGVKRAIKEFENIVDCQLAKAVIGDFCSIAIIK